MSQLSRGLQATRAVLCILNSIFLLFGLVLFGFGIYLIASKSLDVAFFEDHVHFDIVGGSAIETLGIILTVTGAFTVIISLLGCLGTLLQNRCLLWVYAVVLIILMILELAAFITSISTRSDIDESYRDNLKRIFNEAYSNNDTDYRKDIEYLEDELKCCGVDGSDDYTRENITIPPSCYHDGSTTASPGCADAIISWITTKLLPAVSGIVGAVFIFEIFGVIASIIIAYTLSHLSYGQTFGNL